MHAKLFRHPILGFIQNEGHFKSTGSRRSSLLEAKTKKESVPKVKTLVNLDLPFLLSMRQSMGFEIRSTTIP